MRGAYLSRLGGKCIALLDEKAESAGGDVVYVDPRGTSQECSGCGAVVKKSLSVRTHRCDCGVEMDRDVNAAINILHRGLSPVAGGKLKQSRVVGRMRVKRAEVGARSTKNSICLVMYINPIESFIKHLSEERNCSEHTVRAYRGDLENFRKFLLKEEKKIENADITTINAYVSTLYGRNSPASVERKISSIRSFFSYLVKKGIAAQNPAKLVRTPRKEKRLRCS